MRRAQIILVLSLLGTFTLAAFWIRFYRSVEVIWTGPWSSGGSHLVVARGQIWFIWSSDLPRTNVPPPRWVTYRSDTWDKIRQALECQTQVASSFATIHKGADFSARQNIPRDALPVLWWLNSNSKIRWLNVPAWIPSSFAAGVLLIVTAISLRRWRVLPGHCDRCGYDLRASPDFCPECGQTREQAEQRPKRSMKRIVVAVTAALVFGACIALLPSPSHPLQRVEGTWISKRSFTSKKDTSSNWPRDQAMIFRPDFTADWSVFDHKTSMVLGGSGPLAKVEWSVDGDLYKITTPQWAVYTQGWMDHDQLMVYCDDTGAVDDPLPVFIRIPRFDFKKETPQP